MGFMVGCKATEGYSEVERQLDAGLAHAPPITRYRRLKVDCSLLQVGQEGEGFITAVE
jgi:hypothetical protein